MKKKLLSISLAVLLVFTAIPLAAYADSTQDEIPIEASSVEENKVEASITPTAEAEITQEPSTDADPEHRAETEEAIPAEQTPSAQAVPSPLAPALSPYSTPATLDEFNDAVEFEVEHVSDNRSGNMQILKILYVYSDGTVFVPADEVEMRLTFPSGVLPTWPSTSSVKYSSAPGPNGSTVVTIKWNDFNGASGKDCELYFSVPNGTTPNGTQYEINADVYYYGEKSIPNSDNIIYTALTDTFRWQNFTHSPSTQNTNLAVGSYDIPEITINYNTAIASGLATGLAYTKELVFKDKITVSDDVLFLPEDVTLSPSSPNGILSYNTKNVNGIDYVSDFTVEFKVENTDISSELIYTAPNLTVKNAKINDTIEATKVISVLTSSIDDLKGKAYPAVAVDNSLSRIKEDSDGNQYQELSGTNALDIRVTYNQPASDAPTLSQNISKAVQSVNGNSTTERKKIVYAGDTSIYQIYGFGNRQQSAMTSYKVTDTFDETFYPTKMTTGSYSTYSPLTTYRINVYTTSSGSSPAIFKDVSFNANSVIDFSEFDLNFSEIRKIEFDYGAVPSGFTVRSVPSITCKAAQQTTKPYQNIINTARVDYTYDGNDYNKDASTTQEYKVRTPGTNVESFNKSLKNLTNPSSRVPAAGDLVEYTISFTNETGIELVNPEVEDRYTNQSPYLTPVVGGYTSQNIKIISAPDAITLSNVTVRNQGASDEHMFITMHGKIKAKETIKLSYVMQISPVLQKGDMINNTFDVYGWHETSGGGGGSGSGSEPQRVYIAGGYNTAKSSGQLAIPQAVIYQSLTKDSTGAPITTTVDAVSKDETVTVKIRIENDDYLLNGQSDVLHLKNILYAVTNSTAFELVSTTPCTLNYTSNGVSGSVALTSYSNTNFNSNYSNFAFTMPEVAENSLLLYPNDYAEITFQIKALRHANVSSSPSSIVRTENLSSYAYGLFSESQAEYINSLGSVYNDSSDYDRNPASTSYIYTNQSLWLMRQNQLYGGIQRSVSPQTLDLTKATTRTYSFRVYNYSDVGLDMTLKSVMAKLPLYESYVSGSAQAAYNTTNGLTTISAQENKVLADGRRVIEFSGLPTSNGKVLVDPEGGYLYVTFQTQFVGGDLEAAIKKSSSWSDSNFIPAVTLENNGEMGSYHYTITKTDDIEDWDNDSSTDFHYRAEALSVTNTYSAYTIPGVTITPRKIVQSGSTELYQTVNTGDNFSPSNNIGWNINVQNTSSTKDMVNPTVVIAFPYGMRFLEFEGNVVPGYVDNVQETIVNNSQVLTITLNQTFLNSNVNFNIKTSAIGCAYGSQTAQAYLAPNQSEIFYTPSAGTKEVENLEALTGIYNPDYSKDWNVVQYSDTVKIFGTFAFDSNITISGDGKTAKNGGYITVSRDLQSFSYTLNFQNASTNKDYKDVVIVDRMPGKGDIYNNTPKERGSTLDINLSNEPVISIGGIPLSSADYTIEYTNTPKNTGFEKGDYGLTGNSAATWSSGMAINEATAFRVILTNPLLSGQTLSVTFDAEFACEFPLKDAIGYNSFGVGFRAKANPTSNFSEIIAEPPAVGITFDNIYIADISGRIFIDYNGNGVFDENDEYYSPEVEFKLEDSLGNKASDPCLTSTHQGDCGYYEFKDYTGIGNHAVSFQVPEKYALSSVTPISGTSVVNSFAESKDEGIVQFTTTDGIDETFVFDAGITPTQGKIDGTVFIDNNDNGIFDEGDILFDTPVNVTLVAPGQTPLTTTTDVATGGYVFDYVDFADYQVQVSVPDGYIKTSGTTDFIGTTGTIQTSQFTVNAAAPNHTKNAGLALITNDGVVQGSLFHDKNNDLNYDSSADSLIPVSVQVDLINASTNQVEKSIKTTTGFYQFTNVEYANYKVRVSQPNGYVIVNGIGILENSNQFGSDYQTATFVVDTSQPSQNKNAGFITTSTSTDTTEQSNNKQPSDQNNNSPKTQDSTLLYTWIIIAVACVAAVTIILIIRHKKKENE